MRSLLVSLFLVLLLVSCEFPTTQSVQNTLNSGTPSPATAQPLDRGLSALVIDMSKSVVPLNIELGKYSTDPTHYMLYFKNVLLVPTYSSHDFTTRFNYSSHYVPLEDVFTSDDLGHVNSPFDLSKTSTNMTPKDEVALTYFIVDGGTALEAFKKHIGFVEEAKTPKLFVQNRSLEYFTNLTVKDEEVTVICLLDVKAFEVTRNGDYFSDKFLVARQAHVAGLEDQFTQDYGDSTCSKETLGGYYFIRRTFSISKSKATLREIREALLDDAKSYFNLDAKKDPSESTKAVLSSLQETLPYTLGHSGTYITFDPAFPTASQVPSILKGFVEDMKNPDNIVTFQRDFTMHTGATN